MEAQYTTAIRQPPRNGGIHTSFIGSRLLPVLAIRDENLLRSEGGKSPLKKVHQRVVSLSVYVPEEKSRENESVSSCKGPSPPLKRKCLRTLDIPLQRPVVEAQYAAAMEQLLEINEEGFHSSCPTWRHSAKGEEGFRTLNELLVDAFQIFDSDNDGYISTEELLNVMVSMGDRRSLEDCLNMINVTDSDGDGFVDFEEIKKMMTISP